jgi:type VI secretion system secreted protein Hcp
MILLQFKGDVIKGESQVDGHPNWINVDSFQLGVGRAISASGRGSDRDTSTPSFSEATFHRSTDKASPDLFFQAVCGKSLGEAKVHFIQKAEADKDQVYLEFVLGDPIVSSYSISSGGERPSESFSLNFVKISKKYTAFSGAKVGDQPEKKWDLVANKSY